MIESGRDRPSMAQPTIAQQRLIAQRIVHTDMHASDIHSPYAVVRWLGALQAQDFASGAWTIGVRLPWATLSMVEDAIAERAIVRTWLLRGTLHIVAADDLRWMLALLAPTLLDRFATSHRQLGLDTTTVKQGYAAISRALQGGAQHTRKEVLAALAQAGLTLEPMAASNLLNRAALEGLLCLGPMQGRQATFVLLDEWLPQTQIEAQPIARNEALAALALRYFASHGPATLQDFAWWTGLRMEDARAGLAAVEDQLVEEVSEGRHYWRAPIHTTTPRMAQRTDLLPGFDEFVLGYADRRDIITPELEKRITGTNAVFAYTMILDGRVVGTWKRTLRRRAVEITFAPFMPLSPAVMNSFTTTAQRYAEFLGLEAVVR